MIALLLALQIHEVSYPPSTAPGELVFGVTYTIWLPPGVKSLRGVIVHQHGCGSGACKGGATAAYDLHWQALAKKWDCALLGPSYHQEDGQNCSLWCDPRNGSGKTFLKALADLESGLKAFVILRDGKEAGQLPERPQGRFGKPLFQAMSYHDTPEKPLPALRWTDPAPLAGLRYRVIAVNAADLRSEPSAEVVAP